MTAVEALALSRDKPGGRGVGRCHRVNGYNARCPLGAEAPGWRLAAGQSRLASFVPRPGNTGWAPCPALPSRRACLALASLGLPTPVLCQYCSWWSRRGEGVRRGGVAVPPDAATDLGQPGPARAASRPRSVHNTPASIRRRAPPPSQHNNPGVFEVAPLLSVLVIVEDGRPARGGLGPGACSSGGRGSPGEALSAGLCLGQGLGLGLRRGAKMMKPTRGGPSPPSSATPSPRVAKATTVIFRLVCGSSPRSRGSGA